MITNTNTILPLVKSCSPNVCTNKGTKHVPLFGQNEGTRYAPLFVRISLTQCLAQAIVLGRQGLHTAGLALYLVGLVLDVLHGCEITTHAGSSSVAFLHFYNFVE